MNTHEAVQLLAIIGGFDARAIPTDEASLHLKAEAWARAFDQTMPYRFAAANVVSHYASSDEPITPATTNDAWHRANSNHGDDDRMDSHCGKTGCICSHSAGCYRGWVDTDATTEPCQQCRPMLAQTLRTMPEPGKRQPQHMLKLATRGREQWSA